MKRKLIALPVILALLLTMFAGCGSSSTAEDTDAEETAQTETAAEAGEETEETEESAETEETEEAAEEETAGEAEAAAEPEEAEEAAEEAEETASAHQYSFPRSEDAMLDYSNEYSLPLTEETQTITWMRTALNLVGNLENLGLDTFEDMDYIQYWQEITNVDIEFLELEFTTSTEMMGLYIASGDYADIITDLYYTGDAMGAYSDDVIVNLTDLIEEWAPNYYYMINSNEDYTSIFLTDGLVLYFQSPYEDYVNNQGLVVRSDWLEEQGLDVPTTYDELYEVLTVFKTVYGAETPIYFHEDCMITGLVGGYDVMGFAAGGNATSLPYYVVDGEIHCSLVEDGFREYLTEMHKWYEEGLIDPDFVSVEYDPFSSYLSGQITSDQMGVWCTSGEGIDTYTVPIVCMPNPTANEDGIDHISSVSLLSDSVGTYITTCCDNVELAMKLVDYFYSEDGILFYNYGFEGVDYTIDEDGTPQFTDAVLNNEYDLTVSNYMRLRCGYGVFSSMMLRYRTASYNTDLVNEGWDVWSSNLDGSMAIPSNVSMDEEETEASSYYTSDIVTYASQMIPQFIRGDVSLDDWDSFVEMLYEMNIQVCIDAEQSAYDRCMGLES